MINKEHYNKGGIQPIKYITSNNMDFLEGNIIKYVTRYKHKNGVEDLEKAKDYLERLIMNENVKNMEKELEKGIDLSGEEKNEAW